MAEGRLDAQTVGQGENVQRWDQGLVSWEVYRDVDGLCWDRVRSAKACWS